MRALVLRRDPEFSAALDDLPDADLPDGDVLIDVSHSSLNYKDGLAVTDRGKIVRGAFPFVPGIDLAGTVAESADPRFEAGDAVVLTGWGTGEDRWGGYAERARASADHLVKLPDGLDARRAMGIGTAGFTAMLAVMALEDAGVLPDAGEVVVTGASGGVGSMAVAVLSKLGYRVVASTGSEHLHGYLEGLGAERIIGREALGQGAQRPLDTAKWAGAVDSVGGPTLAALLSQTDRHGAVVACGLAGSHTLETTVFPFILRGVRLVGIDSNTSPAEQRHEAWARLAQTLSAGELDRIISETIPLAAVPEYAEKIVEGQTQGRVVVEVRA